MVIGKVYGAKNNSRFAKVLITAEYSQVDIETDESFKMGVSNRDPSYLKKFPLGQAPVLELNDGRVLTESSSIIQYIAEQKSNNPLLGKDAWERSQILSFSLISEAQISPEVLNILFMIFGINKKDQNVADKAYVKLDIIWNHLNHYLTGRNYLVSDRMTLADIDLTCALMGCYKHLFYPELRSKYPELERYFKAIMFLPEFQKHFSLIRSEDDFLKERRTFS